MKTADIYILVLFIIGILSMVFSAIFAGNNNMDESRYFSTCFVVTWTGMVVIKALRKD